MQSTRQPPHEHRDTHIDDLGVGRDIHVYGSGEVRTWHSEVVHLIYDHWRGHCGVYAPVWV